MKIKIEKAKKILNLDIEYFVKNVSWMSARQFFVTLFSFILSIILVRNLGQEIFGHYQFILSIFALVSMSAIPGFYISLYRSITLGNNGDYFRILKKSIEWSIIGFFVLICIGIFYLFSSKDEGLVILIGAVFFFLIYPLALWKSFMDGKVKYKKASIWLIIQSIVVTAFTGLLVYLYSNIYVAVLSYLTINGIFNIIYFLKSRKYIENNKKSKDVESFGYFLTKISILARINAEFDKIIIGLFSMSFLAIYTVALQFIDLSKSSLKAVSAVLMPKVTSKKKLKKRHFFLLFFTGTLLAVILLVVSKPIITLVYGSEYMDSYELLKILSFAVILYTINSPLGVKIGAEKNKRLIFLSNFVVPLISIVISLAVYLSTNSVIYLLVSKIFTTQILTSCVLYYNEFFCN